MCPCLNAKQAHFWDYNYMHISLGRRRGGRTEAKVKLCVFFCGILQRACGNGSNRIILISPHSSWTTTETFPSFLTHFFNVVEWRAVWEQLVKLEYKFNCGFQRESVAGVDFFELTHKHRRRERGERRRVDKKTFVMSKKMTGKYCYSLGQLNNSAFDNNVSLLRLS